METYEHDDRTRAEQSEHDGQTEQPERDDRTEQPERAEPPAHNDRTRAGRAPKRRRVWPIVLAALAGAIVALAGAFAIILWSGLADGSDIQEAAQRILPMSFSPAEPEAELPGGGLPIPWPDDGLPDPADELPTDKLFITAERRNYQEKDLQLIIPVMDLNEPVYNGTKTATLNKGACLYEVSQLPGKGNRNVSIAGHRNGVKGGKITEIMFYHLDKVGEGDYLYLCDDEKVFRYLYKYTVTVEEDDWSEIYSQGYSCLTLTTCTPIGVADHRLIVRAELDGIFYKTEDFDFTANNSI
jgi:LPXTG-site transpeptidase (sortase) family protein